MTEFIIRRGNYEQTNEVDVVDVNMMHQDELSLDPVLNDVLDAMRLKGAKLSSAVVKRVVTFNDDVARMEHEKGQE